MKNADKKVLSIKEKKSKLKRKYSDTTATEELGRVTEPRWWTFYKKTVFWTQQDSCTYELKVLMIAYTQFTQTQTRSNSILGAGPEFHF